MTDEFEKKYRSVVPAGRLFAQGRTYFLLSLHPIAPDWESLERRFAVVPYGAEGIIGSEGDEVFYSYARHIVIKGDYLIEYSATIGEIKVWDLGMVDLSAIDLEPEDLEVEPDPVELMDILREVEETNG